MNFNEEFGKVWKEMVVSYFKLPSLNQSRGADENHGHMG